MDEDSNESPPLTRLSAFIRSLFPAAFSDLFFLCGFTFLFIAPSLGWWPEEIARLKDEFRSGSEAYRLAVHWWWQVFLITLPIRVAAAATLFAYFFPTHRSTRRLFFWIYLPVLASFFAFTARLFILPWSPSVLISPIDYLWSALSEGPLSFLRLGPGFHYALAGLLCVTVAAWRARSIALASEGASTSVWHIIFVEDRAEGSVGQTYRFILIAILVPLLIGWVVAGFTVIYFAAANAIPFWHGLVFPAYTVLSGGLFSSAFLLLTAWAIGSHRRQVIRNFFRFPSLPDFAFAIFFPLATACSFPLYNYLQDRFHWAAFDYGRFGPPLLTNYLHLPGMLALWAVIPAVVEEIAWRGYLQPRLIALYGLVRGIFFTGIIWGAFHFAFDFRPTFSDGAVIIDIIGRLTMTVAISVALAWVTVRSGSVLPAAIIHGLYNATRSIGLPWPFAPWTIYALWLLTGLALFHFWPPKTIAMSIRDQEVGASAPV